MIKKRIEKIALSTLLMICSLIILYPLIYIFFGALCSREEYMVASLLPWPASFTFDRLGNFTIIFTGDGLVQSFLVTMARTVFYAATTVFFSVMGGYLFAKVSFRGKQALFLIYMSTMMVPAISMMVPNYILLARFPLVGGNNIVGQGGTGFVDNVAVLFATGWVSVYNMFLIKQSMTALGDELNEAAQIDGAGRMHIIFGIYLPLCIPVLAVMMIGLFIGMWNDYTTSLIYLPTRTEWHTIGTKIIDLIDTIGTQGYDSIPNYPVVYGISLTFLIPPVVVFLIFQKQMISGLALGAVKG